MSFGLETEAVKVEFESELSKNEAPPYEPRSRHFCLEEAENVDHFVFLGSQISITGGIEEDVITKKEKVYTRIVC